MGGGRGGRFGSGRGSGGRGFVGGRAPPRAQGWETVDRSKQACVFFAQGKCTKGDACPFSHATSAIGGVSQPVVGHTPERAAVAEGQVQPTAADTPLSRLPPAAADPPLSRIPVGHNGDRPRTEASASERTNGVSIGSTGLSSQGGALASASVAGRNGPGPSSNQDDAFGGGTFATGPAAAVLSTTKTHLTDRNGQTRATASLNQRQETQGHAGIIALPDGGFVTRKRAAELQLGRDERCVTKPRQSRQRNDREQGRAQERRSALLSGNRGSPPSGRVSIMDRLGPAKQATERAPTKERIVGPVRTRPEVPGQQARKRELLRQHTSVERPMVLTPSPSLLPRSRALGSTRPTRRAEGGRGDGVSTSPVARLTTMPQQQKSTALDFKIPTLDEIKSRKAKAEGPPEAAKKREERSEHMSKVGQGLSANKDTKPDRAASGSFSRAAVSTAVESPLISTAVASAEVHISAPGPAVMSNPPQLDAEDMDEFSEWL